MNHPDRTTTEKLLRANGFSARAARALLGGGWRGLVDDVQAESDEESEAVEMLESIRTILSGDSHKV